MNTIKPLAEKILVQRVEAKEKTEGGIFIPDAAKERPKEGKVIALGDGKVLDNGNRSEFSVKKGDRVLFTGYGISDIKIDGQEYLVLTEDNILAVIK